jgi:hypothetical protein
MMFGVGQAGRGPAPIRAAFDGRFGRFVDEAWAFISRNGEEYSAIIAIIL